MKQYILLFLIVLFAFQLQAQKTIEKQLQLDNVSTILIEGNIIFKISVETRDTAIIEIKLKAEGSNSEHVVLRTNMLNDTLFVSSGYQPLFKKIDDKLSAHKVISIELEMIIPEKLSVIINSDLSSVFVKGAYANMHTELMNGHFIANHFTGNALINTVHGNILIETNFAECHVSTKNGIIKQADLDYGNNQISLNSINGNITIQKIE